MTDQPISLLEAELAVDYAFVEKCEEENRLQCGDESWRCTGS